jgi:hypothetical protein
MSATTQIDTEWNNGMECRNGMMERNEMIERNGMTRWNRTTRKPSEIDNVTTSSQHRRSFSCTHRLLVPHRDIDASTLEEVQQQAQRLVDM